MHTAHIIDEVIFDLSFASTINITDDHESKVSAWITEQILPAVDSVFNEFDEAKTVFRLDLVEVDLGDVTEEAFQTVLAQRLRERLNSLLHGVRDRNGPLNADTILPVSRMSYAQVDLKQLQFFLMTGQMAWHVSTSGRQAHEQILERVLQEKSDAFIQFLKQSTVKRTLINRLVKQFGEPYLVRLLQKIIPNHAALTLNLLEVYRTTITEKRFSSVTNAASIDALWTTIFDVFLEKSAATEESATVMSVVVEKLMLFSAPDSVGLIKKMQRVATRLKLEKKIDSALLKILADVRDHHREAVKQKGGRKAGKRLQKDQKSGRTIQYLRIIQALKAADIAAFHPLLKGLRKHPANIHERLATQGKQAAIRVQLAEKLTDDILLDITGLFMPIAVNYIKQLLAQSSRLHQGVGDAAWKQQLWESNLNYLFVEVEPNVAFVPVDYLKSLARLMSPTHDAQSVLRVWNTELSTATNTQSTEQLLTNLLQQLVADEDRPLPLILDQQPSDSDAYKTLVQRLQQDAPQVAHPLQPVIAELAQAYPEQLQRIYDAIRVGTLLTTKLNVADQYLLLMAFIDHSPEFNVENRAIFIQAITSHAEGAADQSTYYQQILQALLHDQPVDLDAMQRQKTIIFGEKGATIKPLETEVEMRVKETASIDRTVQYQRIVQALEEMEIAGFYPLPEGLQQHPVMIRQLLAEHGKRSTTRQQLAVKLTDKILVDITDLYIPAAVSYIEQLLAQAGVLRQGEGEIEWKKRLWDSHLSYLFTEPNITFIPTDYLKALAKLMSPTNDTQSVLVVWHQKMFATMGDQLAEQAGVNLLQYLIAEEDGALPLEIDQLPSSEAYKRLIQRLQQGDVPQNAQQPLQPVIAELARAYPEQLQRVYDAIRSGSITIANLSAPEHQQLLITFIDQAPAFNAANRTAFIQAIARHAEGAADRSIYYQQILQALLHDQPVDLETIQKNSTLGENDTAEQGLKAEGAIRAKQSAIVDRTTQYQRIVQALEEMEIVGFYPLPEGLQQHPVMIRRLLAEQGKQATTRQQLAVKLTDKILIDITDLFIPGAVSYIEHLLARASILHQGVGEVAWKQQLWKSNLSYLFTELNVAFIPAYYLKALARLMSPTNDAQPVLIVWYQKLFATMGNLAEQMLVNLLQQLIADAAGEDSALSLELAQHPLDSDAYQTLVQQLQCNAPQIQEIQSLQAEIAELAQKHPQQCQRIYEAIRNGTLSTTRLNIADQQQLLTSFIDQAPAFNAENRAAFIQAIESYAEGAADRSTYYQLILRALLHDQPVDLVFLSKQTGFSESLAIRDDSIDSNSEMTDQRPLIDEYDVLVSEHDIETKAMIEINNAGQIIAAPYMPRLFKMLKLVDDEGLFVSLEAAERAVHLLQFMVDEQSESPEYMLILNKILCGIPTAVPIRRQLSLSEHEKTVVEDLIKGMIQNWKVIGSTSVGGFRETFLQRDGGLLLEDDAWHLTVHPGTFDMLLDGLPWHFSIVKHAWMDKAIHVDWR